VRVAIIGGNSSADVVNLIACLLRARDERVGPVTQIELVAYEDCVQLRTLAIESEDPFKGGGRTKGEKKRAARERRMKGGY
jgi:hypothetical protein